MPSHHDVHGYVFTVVSRVDQIVDLLWYDVVVIEHSDVLLVHECCSGQNHGVAKTAHFRHGVQFVTAIGVQTGEGGPYMFARVKPYYQMRKLLHLVYVYVI